MNTLAVGVAFLSAVAFACSTSLQHQAAQRAPLAVGGQLQLIAHLFRQPAWLLGQLLSLTGLVLHSAALSLGSIALVQPVVISGVVLAVPVRSALSRRWPWPRELVAVGVTAIGLTVFLVASDPTPGTSAPLQGPALLICAGAVVVALAAALAARFAASPVSRAFLLGSASGALFGLTAGLIKCVLYGGGQGGLPAVLTSWTTWALIGIGGCALANNQAAYRLARLSASMPALNVVNGLVALTFGLLAFDEVPRHSALDVLVELLAFLAIAAGLVIVGGLEERSEARVLSQDRV